MRVDGRRRELGTAKQRTLLTVLLLDANRVVSRDRLIDALWGANPPATATTALRVYVSRLRKLLADGDGGQNQFLVNEGTGYVLRAAADQLDLLRLEDLLGEADVALTRDDAASASASLGEALALWRGPALDDFTYEPFVQPAIARLEELRVVARERRIESELALGRHAEILPELESLVAEYPLREQLRRHLMLALYRTGRQADALAVYKAARKELSDELGIDPSPALRDLEQAVLRQDPALDLTEDSSTAGGTATGTRQEPGSDYPDRALLIAPSSDETIDTMLELAEPLARRPERELLVARLVGESEELSATTQTLHERLEAMVAREVPARTVAFTSAEPGPDLVRLASEQDVDVLLLDDLALIPEDVVPSGPPWRLGVSKHPVPRRIRMRLHPECEDLPAEPFADGAAGRGGGLDAHAGGRGRLRERAHALQVASLLPQGRGGGAARSLLGAALDCPPHSRGAAAGDRGLAMAASEGSAERRGSRCRARAVSTVLRRAGYGALAASRRSPLGATSAGAPQTWRDRSGARA